PTRLCAFSRPNIDDAPPPPESAAPAPIRGADARLPQAGPTVASPPPQRPDRPPVIFCLTVSCYRRMICLHRRTDRGVGDGDRAGEDGMGFETSRRNRCA